MSDRTVTITADDFGLAREVNEAVEIGHREGVLTAASLMVGEAWAADAAERARRLPGLRVGLHLTLVGPDGRLRTDRARLGAAIFFRPAVQRQVAAEIEAQFRAYAATGLPLGHVDAHQHFHLHPTIARLLLAIGPRFGMARLRVPLEPVRPLRTVEPVRRGIESRLAAPYARRLRARVRRAGLSAPDGVFGLAWTGAFHRGRLAALLGALPPGDSEVYLHPATAAAFPGSAPGYDYEAELAALTAPEVRAAAARLRTSS